MTNHSEARLIALDWGTSSCRAFLLGNDGVVLQERRQPSGVMAVTAAADAAGISHVDAFENSFNALCADWLTSDPKLPVIACGMIGSNHGWVETPYRQVPADLVVAGTVLTAVPTRAGSRVNIIPGLLSDSTLPDVIRGEETQILGAILSEQPGDLADRSDTRVILLPGTHSKWARVAGTRVTGFTTYMTGEFFALLMQDSTISRLATASDRPDWDAYERGLAVAAAPLEGGGILATAFSARTLVMTDRLAPNHVADYLSGLLIGHEVASITAFWLKEKPAQILLCGEPELNERYRRALAAFELPAPRVVTAAAAAGMWHAALGAGLLGTPDNRKALK